MPLTRPLDDLRRELQEILTEDVAAALTALKDLLPERTDAHTQVLTLQARLKDANKERIRNTLSPDEYQRRVDTIRADCFDLIAGLEKGDFEIPTSAGAMAGKPDEVSKYGSVLYRVPHKMPIRKPSICLVRVAVDADAILEDLVLDEDVRFRERVQVSDMMRADLLDPENEVFTIRALSAEEQLVREAGYTQWLFSVTPKVEGEHQLLVKVSMLEYNPHLGKYVPREVSILETITIVTEGTVPAADEEIPLKSTGEQFALTNSLPPAAPGVPQVINKRDMDDVKEAPPTYPAPPKAAAPPPSYSTPPEAPVPAIQRSSNRGLRALAFFLAFIALGTGATYAFTPPDTRDWWLTRYVENTPQAYNEFIRTHQASKHRRQAIMVIKALEIKNLDEIKAEPTSLKYTPLPGRFSRQRTPLRSETSR